MPQTAQPSTAYTLRSCFKHNKLLIFTLAYMLMPVPMLMPLAQNLSWTDCLVAMAASVLFLLSVFVFLQFWGRKMQKLICTILLELTLIPIAVLSAYLLFAHAYLFPDSIISIFETTPEESREFVAHYMNPLITLGIALYAGTPLWMIYKLKGKASFSFSGNRKLLIGSLCAMVAFVMVKPLNDKVFFISFYKTYLLYKSQQTCEQADIAERLKRPYEVQSLQCDSNGQVIVVVIGESLTRHHLSLYGYGRQTNPLLSQDSTLLIYKDVISPQVHTIPVLRSVLSFGEQDNPHYLTTKPSLFELFNRAGYETYFISNQMFGGDHRTSYDVLLRQAKHIFNPSVQKKTDEVVLPFLQKAIADGKKANKLIVIHLMGNHMAYEFRYPKAFSQFSNATDGFVNKSCPFFKQPEAVKSIDTYDNSVLYNDFVVAQVIEQAKHARQEAAVIYFSDHGEELYDVRPFAGHAYEKVSTYMCEVPFLVWLSPKFGKHRNDLTFNAKTPFSTTDFLFSITDLAGLRYADFDASRSLFNKQFSPRKRYVGAYPYEQVRERTMRMKK